ncbi:Transcription factor [Coemansia sp. RSA 2399]|nr:Transcription factor [Coemansia sp. RSA 2399]KAJ1908404.1 Transcription factor [Coemansia sp. IMI 209127]
MTTHKRRTSKLELEPNPFEQSFSRVRSSEKIAESLLESATKSPSAASSSPESETLRTKETPPSSASGQQEKPDNFITTPSYAEPLQSASSGSSTRSVQRIILPPVTAITTPLHASKISEAWGPESLRSGPLSPAMLGGPAADSLFKPQARTTPRLGLSDPLLHTGLTPFMSGQTHPVITAGPLETSLATTPGLQAVIRATMDGHDIMATPGGSLHIAAKRKHVDRQQPAPTAMTQQQQQQQQQMEEDMSLSAVMSVGGSRDGQQYALKRPAVEIPGVSMPTESPQKANALSKPSPPSRAKRARSSKTGSESATPAAPRKRVASGSGTAKRARSAIRTSGPASTTAQQAPVNEEEDGEEEEDDDDKRQQFLERNRVAALKCRQRKKKQLQELQDRHDYVIMENKRLHSEYMHLREQALQMRAMLAAHRECPVAKANGVFGTDSLPLGMSSLSLQQPLLFGSGPESEQAKNIIAAIPPASNGVPVHAIDPVSGNPDNMLPH